MRRLDLSRRAQRKKKKKSGKELFPSCLFCRFELSEIDLHAELDDAWIARTVYLAEGRRTHAGVDAGVVGVIEHVEGFQPELRTHSFCDLEVFVEREVPASEAGTAHHAAAGSAVVELSGGNGGEGGGVEPVHQRVGCNIGIANQIGTNGAGAGAQAALPGGIGVKGRTYCEGQSALVGDDPGEFPAAGKVAKHSLLRLEEGQIVDVVGGEDVTAVLL